MTLDTAAPHTSADAEDFDFSFVPAIARIALYDDLRSAPRVLEVAPSETAQYIESLASTVYEQAQRAGGSIPYTIIREVTENFIHARFREIVVSVLDHGNTIRFADQGPGITHKEQAQKPGFSSAIEPMKHYIRGVGSGLPIVRDYLDVSHGNITIEDNLGQGSVVTISVTPRPAGGAVPSHWGAPQPATPDPLGGGAGAWSQSPAGLTSPVDASSTAYVSPLQAQAGVSYPAVGAGSAPTAVSSALVPPLSERERSILRLLYSEGPLGVTEIGNLLDLANSSVYKAFTDLEQAGLILKDASKKRSLTDLGAQVAPTL